MTAKTKMQEYYIWANMVRRCTNPKDPSYPRYGGAGVTVCDEWRFSSGHSGFDAFIQHVGVRPNKSLTLDRIDPRKGYEPGNVRWATHIQQANNKKNNRLVNYRGTVMTVADAARAAGSLVRRETAICRLKNGWDIASAVETPPKFRRDPTTRRKIQGVTHG